MREMAELGLPRRAEFEQRLAAARLPVSWLVLKAGGLLTVNLQMGWDAGNGFLAGVAGRLAAALGPGDVLAHMGGNEFAVLLEDGGRGAAEAFGARATAVLSEGLEVAGRRVPVEPVVTVLSTQVPDVDAWWRGYSEHRANTDRDLRERIRRALDPAESLDQLADIVAEHAVRLFAVDAVDVRLGTSRSRIGTVPDDVYPLEVAFGVDGAVVRIRSWSRSRFPDEMIPPSMLAVIEDELCRAVQQLIAYDLASTDALTGLLNRRGLAARFERITSPYSLALVELDDTKVVNDTWGHAAGDRVLCYVADALDDGRHGEIAARWGGDEFVLLMPGASLDDAAGRLRRLLDQVRSETVLPEHPISFSAGVAAGTGDFAADVERADRRMYAAKRAGKSQVVSADAG